MLALLNISKFVVAAKGYRIAPGEKIWVQAYYESEAALKADLSIQKHIAAGEVLVKEIDLRSTSMPDRIRAVELKEEAQRAEEKAIRRAQDEAGRRNRNQARVNRVRRLEVERQEVVEKVETKKSLDLHSLFETSRKDQMARLRKEAADAKEESRKTELEAKVVEVASKIPDVIKAAVAALTVDPVTEQVIDPVTEQILDPQFPDGDLFVAPEMEALLEETQALADDIDAGADLDQENGVPLSEESSQLLAEGILDAKEGRVESIALTDQPTSIEDLPDDSLRRILDVCAVPNRDKIKKRDSLLRAVGKLGLTIEDALDLIKEE